MVIKRLAGKSTCGAIGLNLSVLTGMSSHSTNIIAVTSVLGCLAILAVVLRFWSRRKLRGPKYGPDDWVIVPALLFTISLCVNNIVGATVGRIGQHEIYNTSSGLASGYPLASELKPFGKVVFALQILYTCAMPLIKTSVILYYRRFFPEASRGFHIAIWVVAGYLLFWWTSILFATIFQCNPIWANWSTEPDQESLCLSNIMSMYIAAAISNTVSDLAVIILPCTLSLDFEVPRGNRLLMLAIATTAIITILTSCGRIYAYFKIDYNNASNDYSYEDYSLVLFTSIEPTAAIICACLPMLYPLFAFKSLGNAFESEPSEAASQPLEDKDGQESRPVQTAFP